MLEIVKEIKDMKVYERSMQSDFEYVKWPVASTVQLLNHLKDKFKEIYHLREYIPISYTASAKARIAG